MPQGRTSHDDVNRSQTLTGVLEDLQEERRRLADEVEQRRQAEELSQSIINSALDGVVAIDESGKIVEWNPQAEAMFGWTRSDVLGRNVADTIIPSSQRDAHRRGLERFLATGDGPVLNQRLELTAVRRSGEQFPVELTISANRTVRGWRFSAFIRDVTERRQVESALRDGEERFRSMFQQAMVGMAQIDALTRRFTDANPSFCRMVGYSLDELRFLGPADLDHPDDRERDQILLDRLLNRESSHYENTKRYVCKDGRVIWVSASASLVCDEKGQPLRAIKVVHDVTSRHQADQQLRNRARQLRELAEAALFITGDRPIQEVLQEVTERARELIGAHQAVTSFTTDLNWGQAINGLSLSDKYAQFRNYSTPPDGSGIYALVCETNQPFRMTQAELEAHPRWRGFGAEAGKHPPMRGWLAAPLIAQDGQNLGLIELSDKYEGDFTAEDEAILVQLAQLTSTAIHVRRAQEQLEVRVKQRTKELAESRERMDLALNSAGVGTWDWNIREDEVIWDDYMCPLFGVPQGSFGGNYAAFEKLLAPGESQRVAAVVQRAVREGTEYDSEFRVLWPDQSIRVIAARGKVYRNEAGEPVRMTGVCWDVTERSRTDAIRRALFDQSVNFIGLLTLDGILVDGNQTALAAAGVSPDDVFGRPFVETPWWTHSPELQERLREAIRTAAAGTPVSFEATHPLASGETIIVDFSLKPVCDETGQVIFLLPEGRDITEHKRRDAELQRLLAELSDVAARLALPERGDVLQDQKYRLDQFSLADMMDCGAVIRGLSARPSKYHFAEGLVKHLYRRIVDADGQPAFALVRLFESRRFCELDEVQRNVAASSCPDITPETRCLTLVATAGDEEDWNNIRRSRGHQAIPLPGEEAVHQLPMVSQLLRQLGIEVGGVLAPDPDVLVDSGDTGVFHVREAVGSPWIPAQESFVIPHEIKSVVGFGDLLPDGRMFAVILFSKVSIPRETALLFGHLSQSTRMALLAHVDVPNRTQAQIVSLDKLLRSHERIVAEQEEKVQETLLRLAASNAELEQFAYVASHDLQEPLRKIQSFGNLLVDGYRDRLGDEGQDYLNRMQRAAGRMQTLINDLLTLSRVLRRGQPFQPVDLNEIVAAVLMDLEARIQQTKGHIEAGELPTLDADPTQMRQLMQNLIGNALKYCRPDVPPEVTVSARLVEGTPGLTAGSSAINGRPAVQWEISVSDNGIGFDQEYAEKIFQPFQRLHGRGEYEGTGMGLTICKRIVERHGGTVRAESEQGCGSRFFVTLPARQLHKEQTDG